MSQKAASIAGSFLFVDKRGDELLNSDPLLKSLRIVRMNFREQGSLSFF